MAELVQLSNEHHRDLRVLENAALEQAARQHLIGLRVTELGQAASSMPVFFTRTSDGANWALSAICSFEPQTNLFVDNSGWQATYQPAGLQTYPIFLMQEPGGGDGYTVGIDSNNPAFSKEQGHALFDDSGKASLYLSQTTALLESDIKNNLHTQRFLAEVAKLNLIQSVDLKVTYHDGEINTIQGLHTVNEGSLQALDSETLEAFNKNGYLLSLHAMLMSTFHLNTLIRIQSSREELRKIKQVKLESPKDSFTQG